MTVLLYPLAAVVGGLAGTIVHEAIHAGAALALGDLVGVGWQGGLAGGPYVDFRARGRWRSEAIRKSPLAVGVIALAVVVVTYDGPTLGWVAAAAFAAGLLWSSPEDMWRSRAEQAPTDTST